MPSIIKVSTQQLNTTASQFTSEATSLANLTGEMLTLVRGSTTAWTGEAATAFLNKFNGLEDDMTHLVNMVKEYAEDLTNIANVYEQADKANAEAAQSLSPDVVID